MKTSNKILLAILIVLLISITGIIITSRIMVNRAAPATGEFWSDELTSQELNFDNFNTLKIQGVWRINVRQGDEFAVRLEYPDELAERVTVNQHSSELFLEYDTRGLSHKSAIRAEIVMPNLTGIEAIEGTSLSLDNFDCPTLDIDITGAAEIKADNSSVTDLKVDCAGASHINFKNARVVNAKLDIKGASRVILTMDGGRLTGQAAGASSIVYYGNVTTQDIESSGAVSIHHRKS
jgi:hypothetical protein